VKGHAEKEVRHAQQRIQYQQNQARHDQPVHDSTLAVLQLRAALLALYLGRGEREADIRQFVIPCARPRRYLPKARGGDGNTDAIEAPTQSSRLPPGQGPIAHQQVMRRACHG
jgi:hypothetical protein